MKKAALILALLMTFVLIFTGCGNKSDAEPTDANSNGTEQALEYEGEILMVHSGAGLSKAMDDIGQAFEKKYGATINFNYAGCAQLLSQMEINKIGDVFVGGSLNDMNIATEKGFTDQYVEVAYHIPAIAVPKGNPAGITSLEDMAKPDVKLILGDEKTNAIGKKGAKIFEKNNITEAINANVIARDATVNEIITQIAMKQGDAGLVWEDNGVNAKDIEIIPIPEEQNVIDKVPVCVLSFTEKQELAQIFVDFICSEEGKAILVEHGFETI
ncbi:MAG: molybdate ABC transporter substrate-binding protein [Eubacteriales bacterium]|nr:molybdate ABC transporter substrate-binding protein [Eubacteriales bacterium]